MRSVTTAHAITPPTSRRRCQHILRKLSLPNMQKNKLSEMFSVCYILTQRMSALEIFLMIVRYINVHLIIIIIIINNNKVDMHCTVCIEYFWYITLFIYLSWCGRNNNTMEMWKGNTSWYEGARFSRWGELIMRWGVLIIRKTTGKLLNSVVA